MIVHTYQGKTLEETVRPVADACKACIKRARGGTLCVYFVSAWRAVSFAKRIRSLGVRIIGKQLSAGKQKIYVRVG